jgi:negative regulator of flagellin synthesis FlgM
VINKGVNMDISDKNPTPPINAYIHQVRNNAADIKATAGAASDMARPVEDNVELSQSARDVQYANDMIKTIPDVREDKVAQLKSAIENGTYRIDSEKIAEKMLNESIINDLLGD